MSSKAKMVLQRLAREEVIHPPSWLPLNTHYLTLMGSVAYGCSSDKSDCDIYGFCIPLKEDVFPHLKGEIPGFGRHKQRFEQWQEHHVVDERYKKQYDFSVYSIIRYFSLCMENNPNMVDSLFTPTNCIIHSTAIGNMVRENRKIFLHKGCFTKFKGYAFSQLHKMTIKNPEKESKRYKDVEKHGYDCYVDEVTEFLTLEGWKKFDEINKFDLLATVKVGTNVLEFQQPIIKISKRYTGNIYTINSKMTRCTITERHNVLVSPAHRNPSNNFPCEYVKNKANWQLICLKDIIDKKLLRKRTCFHIMKKLEPRDQEFLVEDEYLLLAGLYVAEGCISFRNSKIKCARVTQTKKGRLDEIIELFESIKHHCTYKHYRYKKEDVLHIGKLTARRLYQDFGHNFKNKSDSKRLPKWIFKLSHRQMKLFWKGWWMGDGSSTNKVGEVIYTNSEKLASQLHAAMCLSGYICSVRGPHKTTTSYGTTNMYQIYLPIDQETMGSVLFSRIKTKKRGYNITKDFVTNCRVVCFEVPNGTLITRNKGNIAIHGNCKFAYHILRLLDECEQILTLGDLDLQRNREQLKSVRRGEWKEEEIRNYFSEKEKELEKIYVESKLPWGPDEGKIKTLLLSCLEHHYGSLDKAIVIPDKYEQALRQISDICQKSGII